MAISAKKFGWRLYWNNPECHKNPFLKSSFSCEGCKYSNKACLAVWNAYCCSSATASINKRLKWVAMIIQSNIDKQEVLLETWDTMYKGEARRRRTLTLKASRKWSTKMRPCYWSGQSSNYMCFAINITRTSLDGRRSLRGTAMKSTTSIVFHDGKNFASALVSNSSTWLWRNI